MTIPKRHHTVPKFLLKNFGAGRKGKQIWVYDKWKDKSFRSSIVNAAVRTHFYEYDLDESHFVSMEESLSRVEAAASVVVRRVLEKGSIDTLDLIERGKLAAMISAQWLRTNGIRESSQQIDVLLGDELSQVGNDPTKVKLCMPGVNPDSAPRYRRMGDADHKRFAINYMIKMNPSVCEAMLLKKWSLLKSPKPALQISDHPVCLHNKIDMSPRGNLGLIVDGIEIYMPLSPLVCLGMFCPKVYGHVPSEIEIPMDSVNFLNLLQAAHASQQLYSRTDDFEYARDFIRKNPEFKRPRRVNRAH